MSIRNFFQPASKRSRDQDDRNDNRNDDRHDERNDEHHDNRNDDRLDDRNDDRHDDRNEDHRVDRNDGRQDDHQGNRGFNRQENPNFSRDPYRSLPLDDKRKLYRCKDTYLELEEIPYWPILYKMNLFRIKKAIEKNCSKDRYLKQTAFSPNDYINMKVSLWQGDITKLEIDAIVNAANERCLGGGGVDGSIHKAAGPSLRKECELLNGCCTGEAKITSGHLLPAKHVIHTVGPRGENKEKLSSCYRNSLQIALSDDLRTLAFCCISTGVFGYPNREAAHVALLTARKWLERHSQSVDRIIFCTYLSQDFEIYQELMAKLYFPVSDGKPEESPDATTKVPQEVSATSKVPIESEDSPKICKSTKIPSESDERQDSLPALDRGSGDIDPKLALGPLQNCEVIDDIRNNPSSSDNLPSIDYSDHDPKRAFETQESVFENVEGSSDSNYAVDVDRTEQACEHEMESGSQQLDDVEMESQRGDDMEMGSQQP